MQLSLECRLDAAPDRVFHLLTTPDYIQRWFGPSGFAVPVVEVDPRVGGRYRFTMQPPEGEPFHLSGEYLDIEPPTRLVLTFAYEEPAPDDRETTVTLTLASRAGGTELRLLQGGFATAERVELHRAGWGDSFEKLKKLLAAGGA